MLPKRLTVEHVRRCNVSLSSLPITNGISTHCTPWLCFSYLPLRPIEVNYTPGSCPNPNTGRRLLAGLSEWLHPEVTLGEAMSEADKLHAVPLECIDGPLPNEYLCCWAVRDWWMRIGGILRGGACRSTQILPRLPDHRQ